MFVGNIKQWKEDVQSASPHVAKWIEFLAHLDVHALQPGRHDIDGINYYNVDDSVTAPKEERKIEAHKEYIDIQFVVNGEEIIQHHPLCDLGEPIESYPDRDCWFYQAPSDGETDIPMTEGTYAIFWPQDGHRALCAPSGNGGNVLKVIIKVHI